MYQVIGYRTDRYDRDQLDERCKDLNRVRNVAAQFLTEPGRKVIIYCHDKFMRRWRNPKRKRRKVCEAISIDQLPKW